MNIHFVKLPNRLENPGILMPDLGIGILTAILRQQKIGVDCIDLKPLFSKDPSLRKLRTVPIPKAEEGLFELVQQIIKHRSLKKVKLLGFSLDEESDLPLNLTLIRFFKELTRATVLLGGNNKFSQAILEKNHFIDFIIKGDATISLPMFLRGESLSKIPGLMYRQGSKVVANPYLRQSGNTDILPDYTDFIIDDYRLGLSSCKALIPHEFLKEIEIPDLKITILPYHFIKGCPNQCSYCFWHRERILKTTDPQKVADHLQLMKEKYKADHFVFLNNEFNPTARYAEDVLLAIKSRKLGTTWSDSLQPATLKKDIFPLFRESGCISLYFGLESLSPRVLKLMNRPSDPSKFSGFLKAAHENNMFNGANFLVGIPFEKQEEVQMTAKFIIDNNEYFEFCNVNLLRIYPEFASLKNTDRLKIKIRDFGSMELRNPNGEPAIEKLLNYAGFYKQLSFYSYDEIGGLNWEKKNVQDLKHVKLLKDALDIPKKTFFEDTRLIAYLMRSMKTKEKILRWYKKIKPGTKSLT